jgi:hypothetical protein
MQQLLLNAMNDKNTDLNLTETDVDVTPNGDETGATVTAKDWIRKLYWFSWRYIYLIPIRWNLLMINTDLLQLINFRTDVDVTPNVIHGQPYSKRWIRKIKGAASVTLQ